MFSHTGVGAGKVGTMSNHQLDFMIDSISRASLSTAGSLSSQVQGILWGSANDVSYEDKSVGGIAAIFAST